MKKNCKKLIATILSALSCCALALGVGFSKDWTVAKAAAVVEDASKIAMVSAQLRTLDTQALADADPAIRFSAKLSAETATAIKENRAQAGMMIFPDSYMDAYEAQDEQKDYCTFFKDAPHFRFTYTGDNLAYEESTGTYYIRGSIGEVQFANLDREFIAIAYVQYSNGSIVYAPVDRSMAKSVEDIASSALNNGHSYSIVVGNETQTPVIEWLNMTAYQKSGEVSYDSSVTNGKNYVYNGTNYSYQELKGVLSVNSVVEEVYGLNDWDFDFAFAGETYVFQTENLADLDVQYSVSEGETIKDNSYVVFNGDITTEKSVTVTARVGNNSAGNFFGGANNQGMPVVEKTIAVKPVAMQSLADMKTANGVVYDWYNTYMPIGNEQSYRAQRVNLNKVGGDLQASLGAHSSSQVVMHLTGQGDNWLYGLTRNTQTGEGNLQSEAANDEHNVYLIEFWYYSEYDTKATFIAMDGRTTPETNYNKSLRVMDFKKGTHKMTLEYESIDSNDQHFVLNFYTQAKTDVYLADMSVRCLRRQDTPSDYYKPTDAEMLAAGGHTWDFSYGNLMEFGANVCYDYKMLSYMTENTVLRGELINETRVFGNYGLHFNFADGNGLLIDALTDNMKVDNMGNGYVYDVSFDAYPVNAGHPVLLRYDTSAGKQVGEHLEFQVTALGNGMYRYKTWVQASADYNTLMIYAGFDSPFELYISSFNIQMHEPMSEESISGVITPQDMSLLRQGTLVEAGIPEDGFINANDGKQWAYYLTDREANGVDDVTLDLYELGLANQGYRFKSITMTIYYYVAQDSTAERVYISHDGHDKAGERVGEGKNDGGILATIQRNDAGDAISGYRTATFTWGYNVGLTDLRYLGLRKTDGSFGQIYIGSIEYEITALTGETDMEREVNYTIQATPSATPQAGAYSIYSATSAITENATVQTSGASLDLSLGADMAGLWVEVPSSQFSVGELVHLSFTIRPDTKGDNGYSKVQLFDVSGKMVDWAFPKDTVSQVNMETTVVSKNGKNYIYLGFREGANVRCLIQNIKVDKDLTPAGNELFGGTKLTQVANQTREQMQSYVIKTWDGEVLVIDGGTTSDAPELARQIRDAVTPERQADGGLMYWVDSLFITHYHGDHIGAVFAMLKDRANYGDIGFKNVYYDFEGTPPQTDEDRHWAKYGAPFVEYLTWATEWGAGNYTGTADDPYADKTWQNRYGAAVKNVIEYNVGVIYTTKSGAVTMKALNRAKFNLESNPANNSSVVYKMETYDENGVQKESVLFLGDLGDYGDTLLQDATFLAEIRSCRVVQMSHHGQAGTSQAFYNAIDDIRICLYPAPDWLFDNYDDRLWGAGVGDSTLINTFRLTTLETRAWMREKGVRYNYTEADGTITLG